MLLTFKKPQVLFKNCRIMIGIFEWKRERSSPRDI